MGQVTKRKLKLREPVIQVFKYIGIVLAIILVVFLFYRYQLHPLLKLNYSEKASNNILFSLKKKDVLQVGENKTLNAAFESDYYKEKYFKDYTKIEYQKQDNLIKNINTFLKKGYTTGEISTILKRGNDQEVSEFAKRDRVRYVDEFFSFDFSKLNLYDRYVNFSDESGFEDEDTVVYVNLDMDKEEYNDANEVNKFSIDMLVNKHNKLDEKFEPDNLVKISEKYTDEEDMMLNKEVYSAFVEMDNAAAKEGLSFVINSAYRSYEDQEEICNLYLRDYGQEYVDKYVAKPGFSEHQTGLAFDIGSKTSNVFVRSKEYPWILENAHKYGFIQRFPSNYERITGFRFESWHFRYVGKEAAKYIVENDMSYEEYYARFLMK